METEIERYECERCRNLKLQLLYTRQDNLNLSLDILCMACGHLFTVIFEKTKPKKVKEKSEPVSYTG